MTLHYAPNGNFNYGSYNAAGDPGADGFNLGDVSSVAGANEMPGSDKGLIYLGSGSTGLTTGMEQTILAASHDTAKVYGFYVGDDVGSPSSIVNVHQINEYIQAHDPSAIRFTDFENYGSDTSWKVTGSPASTDAEYATVNCYPVGAAGSSAAWIQSQVNDAVHALNAAGWADSKIIPIYQAFGNYPNGSKEWAMPTAAQETDIINDWKAAGVTNPAFDYAYSWGQQSGDYSLGGPTFGAYTPADKAALQAVFHSHNG